ncbi:MAG: ribose 5-phosphate isomerase B [Alphaproteobacteria bacterium]|nr:ribose 5-phosphate isomerase B [Alphaproteobacteria bacterium]
MLNKNIIIASDHAGFLLKNQLVAYLKENAYKVLDLGTNDSQNSVDYPVKAQELAHELEKSTENIGILVCGSGIGMCIAINRFPFARGALVYEVEAAKLARQHNNANVLCLGGRMTDFETAKQLVDTFLTTPFEGGRHERRVSQLGG